jgi:hypothetical protein
MEVAAPTMAASSIRPGTRKGTMQNLPGNDSVLFEYMKHKKGSAEYMKELARHWPCCLSVFA